MPPRVALFGRKDDCQVLALAESVREAGGDPCVLNIRISDQGASEFSIGSVSMMWDGVDFQDLRAVYIRGMEPNTPPSLPPILNAAMHAEWRAWYVREQQYQAASYGFFAALVAQGKLVVNPLSAYAHHNSKAQFYERMRAAGFYFPETLTTSDPEEARRFLAHRGKVVVKPGIGVGSTRLLRESEKKFLDEVALCPVTLQEYVQGDTFRVHVVGDKVVLALKIVSEEIDSRTDAKAFTYARLQDEEAAQLARATQSLGLHFAAWDIIKTASGRHVYLDCNPGPFLMWVGPDNVRAIYGRLAKYLVTFANTESLVDASAQVTEYVPVV